MQSLEGWKATSKVTAWEPGALLEPHHHTSKPLP